MLVEQLLHAAGSGALKHVQVREYVRALVRDAEPGAPAPSERELVQQFGVARMTVRQAMDALVTEGLLERIPGRGTFVARPRRGVGRLTSFSEDMSRVGHTAENQTMHARLGQAGPGVARALGITAGDAVIHWKRLRCSDGEVIAIEDAYLNEILLPGFLRLRCPAACTTSSARAAYAPRGPRTPSPPTSPLPTRQTCSAYPPVRPCSARRAARSPATPSSRSRAPATAPTSTRCASSSATRADFHHRWSRKAR